MLNKRCTEEMFKDDNFRLFANGSVEQLPHLNPHNLYEYYQQMISSHPMELFVVGDVHQEQVSPVLERYFKLPRKDLISIAKPQDKSEPREENVVIERTKLTQGKLHIGCRTNTVFADPDYIPLIVCNGVFGGYAHSKLFRNVREKESLAYYVSSSIESHKGFMMIMAGIEPKQYEKTVKIIKEQLSSVVQGNISDDELSQTKAIMITQIKESNDQPVQLMERYFNGIVGGVIRNTEELIEAIQAVTKEDIVKMASKIEIDTIYFLRDKEEA